MSTPSHATASLSGGGPGEVASSFARVTVARRECRAVRPQLTQSRPVAASSKGGRARSSAQIEAAYRRFARARSGAMNSLLTRLATGANSDVSRDAP